MWWGLKRWIKKPLFPYFFMMCVFFLEVGESGKSTLIEQGHSQFLADLSFPVLC